MLDAVYIPGSCNLGKSEVRRRQAVGLVGLFFSIISLVALILVQAPQSARLGIFLPLMIASIGYVQSRSKFCLAYGFAGTFNLGKLGDISRVSNPSDRAVDRAMALKILCKSLLLAALATGIVFVLPF
ncbi:MAG: hypothetical protein O3A27_02985 [Actinomycetota bacterium]|nr:hypothetical protein [Actinomycetota bacterium]